MERVSGGSIIDIQGYGEQNMYRHKNPRPVYQNRVLTQDLSKGSGFVESAPNVDSRIANLLFRRKNMKGGQLHAPNEAQKRKNEWLQDRDAIGRIRWKELKEGEGFKSQGGSFKNHGGSFRN